MFLETHLLEMSDYASICQLRTQGLTKATATGHTHSTVFPATTGLELTRKQFQNKPSRQLPRQGVRDPSPLFLGTSVLLKCSHKANS